MSQHAESYRKIRNTFRFLLGNLKDKKNDFDVNSKEIEKWPELERFILHQILSKVYHMRFPTSYMMLTLISGLMIAINTFLIRKYYGLSSFGESSYEIFIYICCLMGLFFEGLEI